jgi:hypothetical protein
VQSLVLFLLVIGQTSETPEEGTQAITFLQTLHTGSGGFISRKAKAGEPARAFTANHADRTTGISLV